MCERRQISKQALKNWKIGKKSVDFQENEIVHLLRKKNEHELQGQAYT